MRVITAQNAGACYGVRRALDLALESAESYDEVHTLGELIHNPRVVAELERSGVHVAHSLHELESGCVVIRSHGVAPQIFDELSTKELVIVDATCPHVLRAQRAAAELARNGCYVIVVGEEGHPEVEGIKAHALRSGGTVAVVSSPNDLPEDLIAPVGVVVQTTQKQENLELVIDAIISKGIVPHVRNTICSATQKRQEEAQQLAGQADVMFVIGGRNSSNTTRLAEICAEECDRIFHIESADEIDPSMLEDARIVGVTAGASTPTNQIDEVATRVIELGEQLSGASDASE